MFSTVTDWPMLHCTVYASAKIGRPSVVRSLTPISRDAISLYLVEGFQCNLAQIFNMLVGIAEKKVFKVRGQRSRSQLDQVQFYGGGIHFDGDVFMMLHLILCVCVCCISCTT